MLKYEIKNRFTGVVSFVAEINCADDAPASLKLGLSVKWAIRAVANLRDTYLRGADLRGADLSGRDLRGADLSYADLSNANLSNADLSDTYLSHANLSNTNLIDGGQRSDGHRFVGWFKDSVLQIRAGCQSFAISDARKHWLETRGGTPLGDETTVILDHIEAVARIRGLVKPTD